jgi:hypothetical protein
MSSSVGSDEPAAAAQHMVDKDKDKDLHLDESDRGTHRRGSHVDGVLPEHVAEGQSILVDFTNTADRLR